MNYEIARCVVLTKKSSSFFVFNVAPKFRDNTKIVFNLFLNDNYYRYLPTAVIIITVATSCICVQRKKMIRLKNIRTINFTLQ